MSDSRLSGISVARFLVMLAAGLTITIAAGLVYGRFSQRWGPAPDLVAAAKHLESLPNQLGNWQLLKSEPIDEGTLRMLSCAGYVNRQYVNRQTGETVSLAITLGPAGPISVHTPEICYSSRDYTIAEERKRITLPDQPDGQQSFWKVSFRPNNASADRLCVCYAWCVDSSWRASDHPRFEFAGRPLLYKLQLASFVAPAATTNKQDPCERFLSELAKSSWNVAG